MMRRFSSDELQARRRYFREYDLLVDALSMQVKEGFRGSFAGALAPDTYAEDYDALEAIVFGNRRTSGLSEAGSA